MSFSLYDYVEGYDSGWVQFLDEQKQKGGPCAVYLPWGPHESTQGIRDFSKSPRLRLERFLGLAHERGLSLAIHLGFHPVAGALPSWTQASPRKALIPYSCFQPEAGSLLLSELPTWDEPAVHDGFLEFVADAMSVLSLYRQPDGPVHTVHLDLGFYEYGLNANHHPLFNELLASRYPDIATFNLIYGTHFKNFSAVSGDMAVRSLLERRPWMFAVDYKWCRQQLLQSFLKSILEVPSMVPLLGLIEESIPSVEESSVSRRILFDGTLLNTGLLGTHPFIPLGLVNPACRLAYELFLALDDLASRDQIPFTLLDASPWTLPPSGTLWVVCSKFLRRHHWRELLAAIESGACVRFLLEVPQYDERMERYELKGFRAEHDLRADLTAHRGNFRPLLEAMRT